MPAEDMRRPVRVLSLVLLLTPALAACGEYDPKATLTRDDIRNSTRGPYQVGQLGHQVPCKAITAIEDALVASNDRTRLGGEAVRIRARKDLTIDSSVWPAPDPAQVVRDLAEAVQDCLISSDETRYTALSGPRGAVGYRAVLKTYPHPGRIERLFWASRDDVVIVGVDDPHHRTELRAADLVEPALAAAEKSGD